MRLFAICVALPFVVCFAGSVTAQSRWEKFQEKMEEFRPKGKILQQLKDNLEGNSSDAEQAQESSRSAQDERNATPAKNTGLSRRSASPPVARQSILSNFRSLPTDGVMLGVQIDPNFIPMKKLVISEVDADSPASIGGLRTGDQITSIGGIPTTSLKSLDNILSKLNGGDQVVIEFVRNRQPERTLVHFPPSADPPANQPSVSDSTYAAELPPAPDVLQSPEADEVGAMSSDLRSVLSNSASTRKSATGRFAPPYNPSTRNIPQSQATGLDSDQSIDIEKASRNELRALVAQQQQQIEMLMQQIEQLQNAVPAVESESVEHEMLILDPNGN